MRRTLPLALVFCSLTAASAAAASEPIAPGEPNPATPPVAVDWRLDQAGRDPLSLDLLAFGSSSCLPGTLSARVLERGARIEIAVSSASGAEVCTADYAPTPLTVRLRAPLRGRLVVGPRRLRRDPLDGRGVGERRVPRVTGLARRDAVAVVRAHGLKPLVEQVADLRTRPRVVGQTPASGRTARRGAPVTLFVSR